ncbi:MAG: hypothetical protein ABSC88_08470 [Terracidiphilus sp.]|jgi:hypothetical protein
MVILHAFVALAAGHVNAVDALGEQVDYRVERERPDVRVAAGTPTRRDKGARQLVNEQLVFDQRGKALGEV